MRILLTCDRYPGIKHDGLTLRIINYLRQLRGRHQFDLLCITPPGTPVNPELATLVDEFIPVQPEAPVPRRGGLLARLRDGFDSEQLYLSSAQISARIREQCERQRYDLIWDAGCNMLLNLGEVRRGLPLLADQVDDAVLALRRQRSVAAGAYARFWLAKQIMLQKRFARRHIENAAAVLFVSQADADSFESFCPRAHTATIANGVDTDFFAPQPAGAEAGPAPAQLVFEGVMGFEPNIDAACYFCADILPLLQREQPDVRLAIVGRDPSAEVQALAGPLVEVTGYVDDIRPYMHSSAVFVCPMRMGAGIKNKILQAWSMGMAVVATTEGAMGLPARDGQNILLRDRPADFAQATLGLLRDPALRQRLGQAGRTGVERDFSWRSKAGEFEQLMHAVARQRP